MVMYLVLLAIVFGESNQFTTNSSRLRAAGHTTFIQRPNFEVAINGPRTTNVLDFNPALLAGNRGFPGIRVRANARAFQYVSALAANIISQQIGRTQIPDINQCLPQVNGCVRVCNIYISYYRCPQAVTIYPTPNNRIRFSIQNFEIRTMGQLGGQVNVLIPLGLFGVLCMDADQISLDVELALLKNNMGAPYVVVTGCSAYVGYVNIYILNGGIVGFVINTSFRNMVENQVRQMMSSQLCSMVPELINNMVNPRLNQIPQLIPITQMLSLVTSALGSQSQVPAYCYSPACQGVAENAAAPTTVAPQANTLQRRAIEQGKQRYGNVRHNYYVNRQRYLVQRMNVAKTKKISSTSKRTKRAIGGQCAGCPPPGTLAFQNILRYFDVRKISDLALSVRLTGTYATSNDFIIDLSGEFSPRGWGGTPFGPFPLYFPFAIGQAMLEVVASDYTINSLLFWMHRREFFAFRVGPETQAFSSLLSTTCGEDYDESSEATSSESRRRTMRRKLLRLLQRSKRQSLSELESLGVCIGDMAPALAEKYPNRKLFLVIRTASAPSIVITARNGGIASVQLVADASMYLDGTTTRVGNIRITVVMDISLRLRGNWVSGTVALRVFKIIDTEGTLGIPQDALDNISSLAKDAIVKMLNEALAKGVRIPMPSLGLPISLYNMQVGIIEHGIYLGTDINVSPSMLAGISPGVGVVLCQV